MLAHQFSEFDISKTAWAISVLRCDDLPLIDSTSSSAIPTITSFGCRSMAITAWAVALCVVLHFPFRSALSASSIKLLSSQYGSVDIAPFAWSCAPLPMPHRPLRQAISSAAIPNISHWDFCPPHLSRMAWSASVLALLDSPLSESIASSSLPRL